MATTLLESINQNSDTRDKDMIHIYDPRNDGYAMCGLRLTSEVIDDGDVDCIVCEDLWEKWRFEGLY